MESFYEHGNEPSGSLNIGNFIWVAEWLATSVEELNSVESIGVRLSQDERDGQDM
jgi:hypothetical protein